VVSAIVGTLAAFGVLVSCSSSDTTGSTGSTGNVSSEAIEDGTPQPGGSLAYALSAESTGWSPTSDQWSSSSWNVARAIFDPLVVAGEDGSYQPWLAESLSPSTDGATWTIRVRSGIEFHDGTSVDADAVVANLDAMKASPLTTFGFTPITGIRALDTSTVQLTLDRPWFSLPGLFAGQGGIIVAPAQLESGDNQNPIGSGPFVFGEWAKDDRLVVRKNPTYWRTDADGAQLPYLDEVTFRVITDPSSREVAVSSGDVDLAHFNEAGPTSRMLSAPPDGTNLLVDESQGDEMTIVLNSQSGPTSDERVRQAMQLSTDREAIVAQYDGAFEPADGPFSPASSWWSDAGQPGPDVDRARTLIDDYRAETGSAPTITLAIPANADFSALAQLLQSQWSEAGIEVVIDAQETTKYAGSVVNGQANALLISYWNGEDPDVGYIYWHGSNIGPAGGISLNFARWSNDEIDEALDTGRATEDQAARKRAYATVFEQFAEHAPILFLYHVKWIVLSDRDVQIGAVDLPGRDGNAQPIIWGAVNLSNTWIER
jgi:4-phytase/acid phosphatase/peptide/nickel transport system substrate-binding protein